MDRRSLIAAGLLAAAATISPPAAADEAMKMTPAAQKRQVAVLFYDSPILLDYAPAAEIFRVAGGFNAFNIFSVGPSLDPTPSMFWPPLTRPEYTYETCPKPEIVIVPGGNWFAVRDQIAKGDMRLVNWMRGLQKGGTTFLGVCTGTYVLGYAGMLDDRPCTSLPVEIARFRRLFPKAKAHPELRVVDDGDIVTASGDFSGIDAALHLLSRKLSVEAAAYVAHTYMDYRDWAPAAFDAKAS